MRLRELQLQLMHDLLHENSDEAINRDITSGPETYIRNQPGKTAEAQLGIYRESVTAGMLNTLAEIYPVCEQLVGEQFFSEMCCRYIEACPSRSSDLDDYGETMPSFIQGYTPAESLAYLSDVARLEWAWHRVFISPESAKTNLAEFAALDNQVQLQARLCMPEHSFLINSEFPVHRIWQINQLDNEDDDTISLDDGGVRLLVWRHELEMRMDVIETDEAGFVLQQLEKNISLLDLCELFSQVDTENDIGAVLDYCMTHGWIDHFESA